MKKGCLEIRRRIWRGRTFVVVTMAMAQGLYAAGARTEVLQLMRDARAYQDGTPSLSFDATTIMSQGKDPAQPLQPVERHDIQYRRLGEKADISGHRYTPDEEGKWIPEHETRAIWNGIQSLQRQQSKNVRSEQRLRAHVANQNRYEDQFRASQTLGGFLEGRFWHQTQEDWVDVLEKAREVSVQPGGESIRGASCQVITAKTPYGDYTLWIDPNRGYCITQAEITVASEDLAWGQPLAQQRFGLESQIRMSRIEMKIEDVEIEKVGDWWFPMKGTCSTRVFYSDGTMELMRTQVQRSNVEWNPDFEAMGAFVMDLPDGTPVEYAEYPGIAYEWEKGKVVTAVNQSLIDALDAASKQLAGEGAPGMASAGAYVSHVEPSSPSGNATSEDRAKSQRTAAADVRAPSGRTPTALRLSVLVGMLALAAGVGLFALRRGRARDSNGELIGGRRAL